MFVIMEEDGTLRETDDVVEWSNWFSNGNRDVGKTTVGPFNVSTVCMGLWAVDNDMTSDRMCVFETMVFGDTALVKALTKQASEVTRSIFGMFCGAHDYQRRYATLEEARAGHAEVVEFVKKFVASLN